MCFENGIRLVQTAVIRYGAGTSNVDLLVPLALVKGDHIGVVAVGEGALAGRGHKDGAVVVEQKDVFNCPALRAEDVGDHDPVHIETLVLPGSI